MVTRAAGKATPKAITRNDVARHAGDQFACSHSDSRPVTGAVGGATKRNAYRDLSSSLALDAD